MKKIFIVSIGIIALSITACSKVDDGKSLKKEKAKFRNVKKLYHGDMETSASVLPSSPLLKSLKKSQLEVSSTKTVGEAFDAYQFAIKKEWRETASENAQFPYYIDFICWFSISPVSSAALREGVVKRGLEIKFVIHENGEANVAMATKIEIKSDGMLHITPIEPSDIKRIITAIYENREITF